MNEAYMPDLVKCLRNTVDSQKLEQSGDQRNSFESLSFL